MPGRPSQEAHAAQGCENGRHSAVTRITCSMQRRCLYCKFASHPWPGGLQDTACMRARVAAACARTPCSVPLVAGTTANTVPFPTHPSSPTPGPLP